MGVRSYPIGKIKPPEMWTRLRWCEQTFGPSGYTWYREGGLLFFRDEKEYNWFMLRWL